MRIVGAGLGRTGTMSLKLALERLLGAPCYHMAEVFKHPEHVADWLAAAGGQMPDWRGLFEGYAATVDWPGGSFWAEISAAFPESIILLSTRDAEGWWKSANATIFPSIGTAPESPWREMVETLMANRFTADLANREAAIAAYEKHNADVRRRAPANRLVEWHPGDGWAPLCDALKLPVPDEPFPHANSTEEFLARHS